MKNSSYNWARWIFALILAATTTIGCRGADSDDSPPPETSAPTLAVSAAKATIAPMQQTLRLLGTTTAMHHVILRAPVAGRVLGMNLKIGDTVRKGQTVAHVLSLEVEAARQGLQVAKKIDPQDAASLEKSVSKYGHDSGIPVVAAESGVVSAPPVSSGQVVAYLDPIADLVDPRSVYVDTAVPAEDVHLISVGMPAMVKSPLKPNVDMPARVAAILPNFNPGSATSAVRIEFTGPERIVEAGAPAEAIVITRTVPDAIVIPAAALFQNDNGNFHVFIVGTDGRAHRVPVTIGIRGQDRMQATSGLAAGDLVITSGGYALSDGLSVSVAQASK
ncbi:MAG TPA: efflux RND transporter periplasmic adaptor subunit [Candidatus Binataceae bacterium]|nr:efflux RND transporter periplasmic adaptor subunit [Candidatus Binataceae bacterium]